METVLYIISAGLILAFIILTLWATYESGYEKGQIDALNGIQKYRLIEFKDGTREYHKEPKPSEFIKEKQDFTIIK